MDRKWGSDQWVNNGFGVLQPVAIQNATRGKSQNGLGVAQPGGPMYTLDNGSQHGVVCVHGTQDPDIRQDHAHTLGRNNGQENAICQYGEVAGSLTARHDSSPCADRGQNVVASGVAVRRLIPVECERLQGFPDGHTDIPWRIWQESKRKGISYERLLSERGIKLREPAGQDCPDGPRYKAIGNSMAVPVMRWIGERIQAVSEILKAVEAA